MIDLLRFYLFFVIQLLRYVTLAESVSYHVDYKQNIYVIYLDLNWICCYRKLVMGMDWMKLNDLI